jgi:hypothetical protein
MLGYRMLKAKTELLQKRQTTPAKPAGGLGGLLAALSSQTRPNSTAPVSTVPEVQDEKAKGWPEAKRRKVRYGPYRIPPISVSKRFDIILSELTSVTGEKLGV